MGTIPPDIADFLSSRRIAVAGVSRTGASAGNPVFRKLRTAGFDVFPVNPHATELEGARAYLEHRRDRPAGGRRSDRHASERRD